jgi:protoheme IX farnesyltransferase
MSFLLSAQLDYVRSFLTLGKIRLSLLVLYSSLLSYFIGAGPNWNWVILVGLAVGGILITLSANAFNQIIEREKDALMERTRTRPLPSKLLTIGEATVFALLSAILGIHILIYYVHPYVGALGLTSLFIYVLLYTPLKGKSPLAVWVGAIPGALPVLIGYYAAHSQLDTLGWTLFFIQFFWQFPHFWIIAWLLYEDYQRAGFFLLPFPSGRNLSNAIAILFSHLPLLFIPVLLLRLHLLSNFAVFSMTFFAFLPLFFSLLLLKHFSNRKVALRVMFADFAYLTFVFPIVLIDRLWM